MTDKELFEDFYTEEQVAKLLKITVGTLRNRHSAKCNHPPRTPEHLYYKKDFHAWNQERLQYEASHPKGKRRA